MQNFMFITMLFTRFKRFVASQTFFWCIVGFLIVQALWIALSSHYPMAFDEDFHFGIIRIYALHLSPFLPGQPAGADMFGAVARDPSYLYHYLFSFPYRLVSALTGSLTTQVITLRCLNIALFASGLIVLRALSRALKAPSVVINLSLLLFVLIPVVPLLAAQINYDNAFIPLVSYCLLLTLRYGHILRSEHRCDVSSLLALSIACGITSLVKYAFLPILLTIAVYVIVDSYFALRLVRVPLRKRFTFTAAGSHRLRTPLLLIGVIITLGLGIQRYGVNLVRYHTPIPACGKVLSVRQCSTYGPWIRDYDFELNKVDDEHNPIVFTEDWLYGMWLRLYFSVDGPATQYQTRGPLPVPALSAIVIVVGGAVLLLFGVRKIMREYNSSAVVLVMTTAGVYIATLWFDEYEAYVRTGQPVAINGRYLLPVAAVLLVVAGMCAHRLLRSRPRLLIGLAFCVVISQLWGGGVFTYILRSNDSWYRRDNHVLSANHAVQRVLGPLTPGYNEPAEFLK